MKQEVLTDILDKIIDYRGKTPKKLDGDWSGSGYRALSALQVKTTGLQNLDECHYVDENIYRKWMKEEVKRGDILMTSEAPAGQVFYWDSDEKIVLSQRLFCLRVNNKHNPIYVKYYLQSDTGQKAIFGNLSGSTVSGVSAKTLEYTTIFTRSLGEETKIANVLYSIDKKIDINNRIIKTSEKLMREIYNYWFVQFDFPDENGRPYKSSGGEMVYDETLKREIPKGWKVVNIEDLAQLTWGQCPDGVNILDKGSGVPSLPYCSGAGDMDGGYIVNCQARTDNSRREAESETILLSIAGTIGKMAIANEKISLGRATLGIAPNDKKYYALVWLLLKMYNSRLKTASVGAVQKIINKSNMRELNIAIPDITDIDYGALNSTMEIIKSLSLENSKLASLRDWLLPMLMNGQVKIAGGS